MAVAFASTFSGRAVIQPAHRLPKARRVSMASQAAGFELPPLPYNIDALEPKISKATLEVHWGKHHQTYLTNLNKQLEGNSELQGKSLEEIVHASWNNGSPTPIFNNAAQSWNHSFYWESMSPEKQEVQGDLKADIEKTFGSVDNFSKDFSTAGATQFGSGWAWLVKENGKLAIKKTSNAENPITNGAIPLLVMDVWEHAYYLDVQNRRPEYISRFVNDLINWNKVAERYAAA